MPSSCITENSSTKSDPSSCAWVREEIEAHLDPAYQAFQSKLIPTIDPKTVKGVRMPDLRRIAKQLAKDPSSSTAYLRALPHATYEENNIHGLVINELKDFRACVSELDAFLPEVNNWATCDLLSPRALKVYTKTPHNPDELLEHIDRWLSSPHVYTVRFGIGMLMRNYLEDRFDQAILQRVINVRSYEYYINMMRAWFFAESLTKQKEMTLNVIEQRRLDVWTHNKSIQKAIESRRIAPDFKDYLRTLKIK